MVVLLLGWFGLEDTLRAEKIGLGLKKNLDLPLDVRGANSTNNEEDAPEVVTFYGQTVEGDAFFYVVDRSCSMGGQGELQRAKQEISRNITEFSSKTESRSYFLPAGPRSSPPAVAPWPQIR